jgi:uncharacterized membrane protein HdeD (DUF308 family)
MFVVPGILPDPYKLTRDAAERISRNWWRMLLEGLVLMAAGVVIFSINWKVRSLATFIGALFIAEGVAFALTAGIDKRVGRANVISGLLSIANGVVIIAWPGPGLVAVAIFLGAWLIVSGTLSIAEAFAARRVLPNWWLLLVLGLVQVPLGLLALADPGATLAALVTVGGIFAVAVGVMRVVLSFEVKRLPQEVDMAFAGAAHNGPAREEAAQAKAATAAGAPSHNGP